MARRDDQIQLKSATPGTNRHLTVYRYGTPGARPKVYMQASLHADEWPGLMVLHHLIPMLDKAEAEGRINGEIIILPYANPIGLSQRIGGAAPGRYAFDGTGNYNRNWPSFTEAVADRLNGPLSGDRDADKERVRGALREVVAEMPERTETHHWRKQLMSLAIDADVVLDLHCDHEALAHLYCNTRHSERARRLAAHMDTPVVLLEDSVDGGAFDQSAASVWWELEDVLDGGSPDREGCFSATVELRGQSDISDALGAADAKGIFDFLVGNGSIAGDAVQPPEIPDPYRLEEVDVLHAPVGGLLAYKKEVGDMVEEGDVIAELIDVTAPPESSRTPVRSRTSGLMFTRHHQRLVQPGEGIAKVAGRTPLAHRKTTNLLEA